MRRLRRVAFLAVALVIAFAIPASAVPAGYYFVEVLRVDGSPGYCGWESKYIANSDNPVYQQAHGDIEVKTGQPGCPSPSGANVNRPYDNLRIRVFLHCASGPGGDTVVWDSGLRRNAANTSLVQATSDNIPWCSGGTGDWPKARTEVNSCFYVFPSGWVCFSSTTIWISPGVDLRE